MPVAHGEPVQVTTANRNSFSGKYIALKTNLNFKSKLSYQNSERTDFGDINGNTEDGNSLMNEMTTGTGFKPIGINNAFTGIFEGQNKERYSMIPYCSIPSWKACVEKCLIKFTPLSEIASRRGALKLIATS